MHIMLNSVIQMENRLKDHFMTVAYLTSQLSDDPRTKVKSLSHLQCGFVIGCIGWSMHS